MVVPSASRKPSRFLFEFDAYQPDMLGVRIFWIARHLDLQRRRAGERIVGFDREMLTKVLGGDMAERAKPDFGSDDMAGAGRVRELIDPPNEISDERGFMHRWRLHAADRPAIGRRYRHESSRPPDR